ncbi:MAG: LysR family transcriptional regulator [Rhodospirillaceae bacterium]|jgi:molybdate transport system regulatory protein
MARKESKRRSREKSFAPSLKVRVEVGAGVIGPGKIELLERLQAEGSITRAAKKMGLSYRRAWYLIDTLNAALGRPVTETKVGGEGGGGAELTPFGRELVKRYRKALAAVDAAGQPLLQWLEETVETDSRGE